MRKNSFGTYGNSREEHVWLADNLYGGGPAPQRTSSNGSAIWIRMSCMNHACVPNVHGSYYGEMLIVRAARDIAAGEELFINYCPFTDVASRQQTLDHWGFQCTCPACIEELKTTTEQLDDRESIYKQLVRITAKVNGMYNAFCYPEPAQEPELQCEKNALARKQLEDEADELVALWHAEFEKLESTFSAPPEIIPRHENGRLLLHLAQFHFRTKSWTACRDCALQALSNLGFAIDTGGIVVRWGVTCDAAVTMAALLYKSAKELGDPASQQYEKTVKTIYLIVIGEDVSFEETYWWLQDEQEVEEVKDDSRHGTAATFKHSFPGMDLEFTQSADNSQPHKLILKFTNDACPVHAGGSPDTAERAAQTLDKAEKKKKPKKKRAKKQNGTTVSEGK